MYVTFEELQSTIKEALLKAGLSEDQAEIVATTHAESSRDGIESHGLNRVSRFIRYVKKGWVNPDASIELVDSKGAMELYDGNLGIGIINAKKASQRAKELADINGIGMVALKNTTHWMRGGTYAWDLVNEGYMSIMWTNTESCMPAWGSLVQSIGNNPMCIGVPYKDQPLVLDMAMSLYSHGKLQVTRLAGDTLPFPGGYNKEGQLTDIPGDIEETGRLIPTGYWKGSGLAIALDMFGTLLTNGKSAAQLDEEDRGGCTGVTQIFIVVDPYVFFDREIVEENVSQLIDHLHSAQRENPDRQVSYPGEGVISRRNKAIETDQIHVDEEVWATVKELAEAN